MYFGLVGKRLSALQKPLLVLLKRHISLQRIVFLSDLGLFFQLFQVGSELTQDVFHPGQVFAGVAQAVLGFAATLFVLGNPGGLFQKQAQLFGFGFNNAANRALPNDGVCARPQARAQKHVLHITPAHRLVVQKVTGSAIAGEHPFDRNFPKLAPLATGAVVRVVKHQLHTGAAGGLAGGGAVENNVLHGLATQLAGLALAQHPAHRIHDVGLAAAVGPHHANQLPRQQKVGGFGEGLESG